MQSNYYQFLVKHFPHKYLHDTLGCRASWRVHKTSNEHYNNNNGVALFSPNFGRKGTSNHHYQIIKQFVLQNSRLSPAQTTNKDPDNPFSVSSKHILEDSMSNLWVDYRFASVNNTVCESVFRQIVKKCKIFARANHSTDMCGYCLSGVKAKAKMIRLEEMADEYEFVKIVNDNLEDGDDRKMDQDDQMELELQDDEKFEWDGRVRIPDGADVGKYGYDLDYLLKYVNDSGVFSTIERNRWNDLILDWHYIMNHRYDKDQINAKYRDDVDNTKPNTIVITTDFKQNMVIGRQKTERNELYNVREARTVFGVHLSCQTSRHHVNHLSDCNSLTATFAVSCVRNLFELQWFKDLIQNDNIQHIVVWSDKGRHFLNCHNLYFWLIELIYKYQRISTVTYNFFLEKHGKSYVDGHFGKLNYYHSVYVKTNEEGVHNTEQLATALMYGHNNAQRRKNYVNNN